MPGICVGEARDNDGTADLPGVACLFRRCSENILPVSSTIMVYRWTGLAAVHLDNLDDTSRVVFVYKPNRARDWTTVKGAWNDKITIIAGTVKQYPHPHQVSYRYNLPLLPHAAR